MVNDFILGVSERLKSFKMPVYVEEVPMGFSRPCFTIRSLGASTEPSVSGYFKETISLGVDFYVKREDIDGETVFGGRNYRLGEAEPLIHEALRFIRIGERTYSARTLVSERKSQIASGNLTSDVEGINAILSFKAEYVRFVKWLPLDDEDGVMEELFQSFKDNES